MDNRLFPLWSLCFALAVLACLLSGCQTVSNYELAATRLKDLSDPQSEWVGERRAARLSDSPTVASQTNSVWQVSEEILPAAEDPAPINAVASQVVEGDVAILRGTDVLPPRAEQTPIPPSELSKTSLPPYRLEPPDVLLIDAVRMAPKNPYNVQGLDVLQIVVVGVYPDQPIAGYYQVEPDGRVNLGPSYGSVDVEGKTLDEAMDAVRQHLSGLPDLGQASVSVTLAQLAGQQQIAGEHLVGPDGTVNLGIYGSVYVSGMTLVEAKAAIEHHLSEYLQKPEVSIDVFSYNSKVFYIIAQGAGFGDSIQRLPITGNETVLDALATIGGLSRASSKHIWIARPTPLGADCHQILKINFDDITRGAATATNYQILPGDRIFIEEDRIIALDSMIAKFTAPVERIFGSSLLGAQTIQLLQRFPKGFRQIF